MEALQLLRRHPLPLDQLVQAMTRDAALTSRVLHAAVAERPGTTLDLGAAIVLLGAARLRALIASTVDAKRGRSSRLHALKKAIAAEQYRIDPMTIARAMLRNLERS